jgi:uncharacterized membrane protein YfcA
MADSLLLFPIGVCVGFVGSLVGVGGGFFVVPFLLLFREGFTPSTATAASLGIVLLNAISSTWANSRRKRIDFGTGLVLAAGTLPGAWYGRVVIGKISDQLFAISFAALLLGMAIHLVRLKPGKGLVKGAAREVTDSEGQVHRFIVHRPLGFVVSLGVGLVSSIFGIGGGLILVPFLVIVFGASTLVAAATAQFTFLFTVTTGLAAAVFSRQVTGAGLQVIGAMGLGVVVGAQLGVLSAKRVGEKGVRWMFMAVALTAALLLLINR